MLTNDDFLHKTTTQDNYTTEKINAINSGLLGDYVDGEYVISKSIIDELLAVTKYKKSTFKNSVFTTCFLPTYGELVFEIVYEKNSINNTAMATIYLLENEYKVNGYLQNTIKSKIGTYIDDLENFIEKSYEHFNISLSRPEDKGKEYKVVDDPSLQGYISAKKQFVGALNQLTEENYLNIYKSYFEERLKLLKAQNNPFTKAVLDKFNLEYNKIEKFFLQNRDYKALSELLDKCFEDIYGINPNFKDYEKEYREKILPVIIQFSQQAEQLITNATPKAINKLSKEDREKIEKIKTEEKQAKKEVKKEPEKQKEEGPVKSSDKSLKEVFKDLKNIKSDLSASKNNSAQKTESYTTIKSKNEDVKEFENYYNNKKGSINNNKSIKNNENENGKKTPISSNVERNNRVPQNPKTPENYYGDFEKGFTRYQQQ